MKLEASGRQRCEQSPWGEEMKCGVHPARAEPQTCQRTPNPSAHRLHPLSNGNPWHQCKQLCGYSPAHCHGLPKTPTAVCSTTGLSCSLSAPQDRTPCGVGVMGDALLPAPPAARTPHQTATGAKTSSRRLRSSPQQLKRLLKAVNSAGAAPACFFSNKVPKDLSI